MSRSNLSSLATLSVSTRSRKRSDPLLGPTGKSDWEDGGGADRRHPKPIEPPELAITAGEQQIQGTFMKLDCDNKGVAYFTVQASDRAYRIRSTTLQQVQLTAYTQAPAEVSCGVRKNPENIVLTFRPSNEPKDARAKIDGDAIAVEIVPKDFKLKN